MKYFFSENLELEQKIDQFFDILSDKNKQKYAGELSILLLGSLSRGEATWSVTADGRFQLLSDIEFFTAYPDGFAAFESFSADIDCATVKVFGEKNINLFQNFKLS